MFKYFSDDEINKLYETKIKLPESYFKKYEQFPKCPVKSYNYNWQNFDFPRNPCILDFIEWTQKYNLKNIDHLGCTYITDPELEFISYNKATILPYPGFDLHTLEGFDEQFDFFVFNQTIEHLYNPFQAISQIYKTIKKGGYVFTSAPTLNIPHCTPIHYNGFNPMGLAMLFKTAGFEIIEIGQWGNYDYIEKQWKDNCWPGYNDINKNGIITNAEYCACQCWILVQKIN
jgi:SAM-dependent methyltransferase